MDVSMSTVKLLSFSGSLRTGSFNQKLVNKAADLAREMGAIVTQIDFADFPLPLYSPQIEESGFPEAARELKALFVSHSGFLIASPEYNGSVSGVLKNAIDWMSRPTGGEAVLACSAFRNKIAGLMSASVGPFGGIRGLQHLRQILGTVHTLVTTQQVVVPFAEKAFDGEQLTDALPTQLLPILVGQVTQLVRAIDFQPETRT